MSWERVADADEVPAGTAKVVEAGGRRIALCNTGEAGFHAIDDLCTHDGGPLDQGQLDGTRIGCPRHRAQVDVITGRAPTAPAIRPVRAAGTPVCRGCA